MSKAMTTSMNALVFNIKYISTHKVIYTSDL